MTFENMPLGGIVIIPKDRKYPEDLCCPCDNRELNRIEYSQLFELIGIVWGKGDGVTTFNIPPKEVLPCWDLGVAIIKIKY